MNIQLAIQKASEITGIPVEHVTTGLDMLYVGTITEENVQQHAPLIKEIAKRFGISPVVLTWLAVNEEDVQPEKLRLYHALKPVIDSIIEEVTKLKDNGTGNNDTNREG